MDPDLFETNPAGSLRKLLQLFPIEDQATSSRRGDGRGVGNHIVSAVFPVPLSSTLGYEAHQVSPQAARSSCASQISQANLPQVYSNGQPCIAGEQMFTSPQFWSACSTNTYTQDSLVRPSAKWAACKQHEGSSSSSSYLACPSAMENFTEKVPTNPGSWGHAGLCRDPCKHYFIGECRMGDFCNRCHCAGGHQPNNLGEEYRRLLKDKHPSVVCEVLFPVLRHKIDQLNLREEAAAGPFIKALDLYQMQKQIVRGSEAELQWQEHRFSWPELQLVMKKKFSLGGVMGKMVGTFRAQDPEAEHLIQLYEHLRRQLNVTTATVLKAEQCLEHRVFST